MVRAYSGEAVGYTYKVKSIFTYEKVQRDAPIGNFYEHGPRVTPPLCNLSRQSVCENHCRNASGEFPVNNAVLSRRCIAIERIMRISDVRDMYPWNIKVKSSIGYVSAVEEGEYQRPKFLRIHMFIKSKYIATLFLALYLKIYNSAYNN